MAYEADAEQVRAQGAAWNRAYLERDLEALDRLLADDWVDAAARSHHERAVAGGPAAGVRGGRDPLRAG